MNFSHFPDLQELGVPLYDLVSCKGTLRVQVLLVIINTIFWKLFIDVTVAYLRPWMEGKPWKDQYLRLFKQTWCKLGIELSDEEWKNCSLMNIPIAVQHVIGGCLCIPSLFPIPGISNEVASILACHGALFETGVEVGDMVTRSYDMAFKKDGFKNNPPMLIVFMFLHHAAGILAVVPFNIYFSDSFLYHEGVFLLQGAAGIGVSCQLYSWTLDLKKKSDLLQMQVISVFTFFADYILSCVSILYLNV
mmetsp:Transcript_3103/g.4172  ORF Transcript_3103/g.4172 Transcript_3103/m.4172 type:complete len:248 (+) Transcript_3103:197-940(+)